LAVFVSSFYLAGAAGLLIVFNCRFQIEEKRMGDVLAGGLFIFVSYVGLEVSNWIIPTLYHVGG
jgi:hypothetical protein